MSLDIINDLIKNVKENKLVQNFVSELENQLSKEQSSESGQDVNVSGLKEEGSLYQIVDKGEDCVYLQNTRTNKVSKETDIPKELQEKIETDYILSYKNGEYKFEEEMTDNFMDSMLGIGEYEKLKDEFEKNSNITEIDPNTKFNVVSRNENNTTLGYGENNQNQLEVPNALLPYFTYDNTVLQYKDGKFEKA